jgi:hypothetical protein
MMDAHESPGTPSPKSRWRVAAYWAIGVTVSVEIVTAALRFGAGMSAVEFGATSAPLLLKIHHAFWGIPLLLAAWIFWRWPKTSGALLGIGCGLVASDLLHHLVVLPLSVGNFGWHWP